MNWRDAFDQFLRRRQIGETFDRDDCGLRRIERHRIVSAGANISCAPELYLNVLCVSVRQSQFAEIAVRKRFGGGAEKLPDPLVSVAVSLPATPYSLCSVPS